MPTVRGIARIAGVSAMTVSNVLNGRGRVSKATRERVERIAQEEGYFTPSDARSSYGRAIRTVGIITPDISNEYFSSIVLEIETAMQEQGYSSFICNTRYDPERNRASVEKLRRRGVDCLFFVGGDLPPDTELLGNLPCSLIDVYSNRRPNRFFLSHSDLIELTWDQIQTLHRRGCERIACITPNLDARPPSIPTTSEEFETIRARCFERGIDLLIRTLSPLPPYQQEGAISNEFSREISGLLPICKGFAVLGDRMAMAVCDVLRENNMQPGRDVKVIGMDDALYSRLYRPSISTINRNTDMMARAGAGAMTAMLRGRDPENREIYIPHRVIERETTLG